MRAAAILSMAEDAAVFYYPDSGKIKKLSLTGGTVYAAPVGRTGRNSFFTRCGSLGCRSAAGDGRYLYIAASHASGILRLDTYSGASVFRHCIGRYPMQLCLWNGYIITACGETDTVEICLCSGGQSFISNRLGQALCGVCAAKNVCAAVCFLQEALYLLSVPQLAVLKEIKLGFAPNGVCVTETEKRGKGFLVYGNEADGRGCAALFDISGDMLLFGRTGFNPVDAVQTGDTVVFSCAGDKALLLHKTHDLMPLRSFALGAMPEGICLCGEDILVGMNVAGRVEKHSMKNGRLLKQLPGICEPSQIIMIDMPY